MLLEYLLRTASITPRRHRHIDHVGCGIPSPAARIERVLEEARHQHPILPARIAEHVLCAVAVVDIEIDDGHSLESSLLERIGRSDSDVVEQAETHGPTLSRVMPAGTNSTKGV